MNWSKIIARSLQDNLQREKTFKPFNDSFDYEKVQAYAKETTKKLTEEETLLIELLPYFHQEYQIYYDCLRAFQAEYKFTPSNLYQYLLALANRDFITFFKVMPQYWEGKDHVHIEDLRNIPVESVFGNTILGKEALETSIDIIDCIMSFYRYFPHAEATSSPFDSVQIKELYAYTSHYIVVKDIFDTIVWEGAYLEPVPGTEGQYLVSYREEYPLKKVIGVQRTGRFMETHAIGDPRLMEAARYVYREKSKEMERKHITYSIDSVTNGEIMLVKGASARPITQEMIDEMGGRFYAMQASLFFAKYDQPIPFLYGLTVYDAYMLFARLQALAESVLEYYPKDGAIPDDELFHLSEYSYRIKENFLISYLRRTTRFQKRQVKRFLDLLVNQRDEQERYGRFNSWRKMLLYLDGYYYFAIFPLLCSNICQLTEGWLEDCGLPLSGRGHEFERYCKDRLKVGKSPVLEGAIIDERATYAAGEESQEIDLVLVLKDYIVVGELKALAYPMDRTRWHNAFQELHKGIRQARIKSRFLAEHRQELLSAYPGAEQKEIVPVVITNYPLYAGFNTEDIPVADINLFCNILTNTPLQRMAVMGEQVITIKKTSFYTDEKDFAANFKSILFNPLPIADLSQKMQYKEDTVPLTTKISLREKHYFIEQCP